jgi:hypothetical protein
MRDVPAIEAKRQRSAFASSAILIPGGYNIHHTNILRDIPLSRTGLYSTLVELDHRKSWTHVRSFRSVIGRC